MSDRSERFARVLVRSGSDYVLKGYVPVQPDGSVLFEVPANSDYQFEIVNKVAKALNQMQNSSYDYQYFTRFSGSAGAVGQTTEHSIAGATSNSGAAAANAAWSGANDSIKSVSAGDTMAQALQAHLMAQGQNIAWPNRDLIYQDYWTPEGVTETPAISISYDQLATAAPMTVACEQSWTDDCSIALSYEANIQPLWQAGNRDDAGNACSDCHDDRGFTNLNLLADLNGAGLLASYDRLFAQESSYMFLLNGYSPVNVSSCRRTLHPPLSFQPQNDCFTCYSQSYMNANGAILSANFFDLFDADADDDHSFFRPQASQAVRDQHRGMLNDSELRTIAEWLDMQAPR